MRETLGNKKLWLYGGLLLLPFCLLGWWIVDYLALFSTSSLDNGPVVIDQRALDTKPDPVPYEAVPIVGGLDVPWSLVFTDTDRWLVSERSGSIRIVEDGRVLNESLVSFDNISNTAEEGLMGLALDPDYAVNRLVYACYAAPGEDGLQDRVVRFEDLGDDVGAIETILEGIPAARFHAGCRLGFGPDKKLYITTGDATNGSIAQDQASLGGKILRINADGSYPEDNPFDNSPIWSLGHRNPQGVAWQPGTDQLFATEHGPSIVDGPAGGDEVNIIQRGANYGWPIVSHERSDERFISPLLVFTPAVAPSGATFYDSDVLPQFADDFFFATLKGEGIIRVVFDRQEPSKVIQYEKLEGIDFGRIRDVVQGPDGSLYFLSSNRDGRGELRDDDDHIYRLAPL